jgi:hypothetical protein
MCRDRAFGEVGDGAPHTFEVTVLARERSFFNEAV